MSPQERQEKLVAFRRQWVEIARIMEDKLVARMSTCSDNELVGLQLRIQKERPAVRRYANRLVHLARNCQN